MSAASPLKVFVVAGEELGDQLGAKLMAALRERLGRSHVGFAGVGGEAMAREGLASLFPLADIAVMGVSAVIGRLPTILRRISDTVGGSSAAPPMCLSLSTVRTSPTAWRGAFAGGCHDCPSSTMSVRACGHGGRAGLPRCADMSIMFWRSCPSSLGRTSVSADRLAPMWGTPSSSAS